MKNAVKDAKNRENNSRRLLVNVRDWFRDNPQENHLPRLVYSDQHDLHILQTTDLEILRKSNDELTLIYFCRKGTTESCVMDEITPAMTIWK